MLDCEAPRWGVEVREWVDVTKRVERAAEGEEMVEVWGTCVMCRFPKT